MEIRWGNKGNGETLYFLGLQNHCRWWLQENKRRLLLGRKAMTKLDSILKSRDITLSTKVQLVKAMVFPVVMYGGESWTVKKVKNWCFWTVVLEKTLESPLDCKEIHQSILKKPVLGVHWKDWCWSWNSNILATLCEELTQFKRLCAGKDWGQEEKGTTEDEMV